MERLTTLVEDLDASFANALVTLDNAAAPGASWRSTRRRRSWTDGCRSRRSPACASGTWPDCSSHTATGRYHGKLLKRTRKQLRSVSSREALTTPFLFRRTWSAA